MTFEQHQGAAVLEQTEALLGWCGAVFGSGFSPSYLTERLPRVADPMLLVAVRPDQAVQGFKLGYRRGDDLFYSWLGGVLPEARRAGVARSLAEAQHEWARSAGYRTIETRTRCQNRPMIILNLRLGFEIIGLDMDRQGRRVVTQRLDL